MHTREVSRRRAGGRLAALFRRRARRFGKDRRGAVLVVVALSMVAFVSMVALVVDLGMLLLAHTEAQRAADSAALAGASSFLTFDPAVTPTEAEDTARARALDYATRHTMLHNAIVNGEVTIQVVLDSEKVRVTVHRPAISLIFARVFGINTAGVAATAAAVAVDAGAAPCVKPFAIPDMWAANPAEDVNNNRVWDLSGCTDNKCSNEEKWGFDPDNGDFYTPRTDDSGNANTDPTGYGTGYRNGYADVSGSEYSGDYGRRFAMKVNGGSGKYMPSFWFPWKMPGNNGAKDYTTAIEGCSSVQIGDTVSSDTSWITAEKGNIGHPTYTAIENLIHSNSTYSNETWDASALGGAGGPSSGINPGDPRIITVALFDPTTFVSSNTKSMVFVDFATFFLEDPDVVNPGMAGGQTFKAPITARYLGRVSGSYGPNKGTIVKRLRLIE